MQSRYWGSSAWLFAVCLLGSLGCEEEIAPTSAPSDTTATASFFDPANSGSVAGRVSWVGEVPQVPAFEIPAFIPAGEPGRQRLVRENPNAPIVHATTRGVASAVVFLRGVAPEQARPWHHPPVRVELRDRGLFVAQGESEGRVGFVRRGDALEMISREEHFHVLRGMGANYFSLTLPEPNQPRQRRLTQSGLVELTSGAGYFWMRGYLFVGDHPYYTRTDAQGRFQLEQVPRGRYRLVCWLPSWVKQGQDRDPETSLVTRLRFNPPLEIEHDVEVPVGGTVAVEFTVTTAQFHR